MKIYTGWRKRIEVKEAAVLMQPTSHLGGDLSKLMPIVGEHRVTKFSGNVLLKYGDKVKHVPFKKGYTFEASIPKFAQWLLGKPTDIDLAHAALLHDILYSNGYKRETADAAFYFRLREDGVSFMRAGTLYLGVRIGGHALYAAKTSKFWKFVANMMGFKR